MQTLDQCELLMDTNTKTLAAGTTMRQATYSCAQLSSLIVVVLKKCSCSAQKVVPANVVL